MAHRLIYNAETMPQLAEQYAKEGYLDKQIAQKLGVRADTFCRWCAKYPQLEQSLKKGREVANIELKKAMLKTAAGYDVEEEEMTVILDLNKQPKSYKKTTRKRHIPPSTTMQIFLAKNRMPDEFKDVNRHEVDLRGEMKVTTLADLMLEEFQSGFEAKSEESDTENSEDTSRSTDD